ncbi:MAG: hypothetical protein K6E91_12150 [Butyrivibrio sp.]|nr:hypothetical protein [Butyrivibrio sp.]
MMKAINISNRKTRGIIKAILAFALFVTIAVFMSSNALAASLPDRDGFKDSTVIKKQGYTISIPTYWESDIDEASEYRAYCNDDAFAMIIIDIYDEMTGVSFKDDKQRDLFVNSVITEIDSSGKLQESSYKKFGNLEGAYSVFNFSMEGIDFKGTMFAAIDGDYCYCFMLAEDEKDNKYDYQPDFFKVIKSAKK